MSREKTLSEIPNFQDSHLPSNTFFDALGLAFETGMIDRYLEILKSKNTSSDHVKSGLNYIEQIATQARELIEDIPTHYPEKVLCGYEADFAALWGLSQSVLHDRMLSKDYYWQARKALESFGAVEIGNEFSIFHTRPPGQKLLTDGTTPNRPSI